MPTMKDVAREASVSLGTVSNVLNNQSFVTTENRQRVFAAVQKLNYRSNMAAKTLKTKTSQSIGLIIPSISNPFYPELARGVEDAASKAGFTVFLCNNDREVDKERRYIDDLISKNVDGLILVKPQISLSDVEEISRFARVVMVDVRVPEDSSYNVIQVDDCVGINLGMELLYSYGHTKIAFIAGLLESESNRNRFQAYGRFLQEKGIPDNKDYVVQGNYKWDGGYNAAKKLVSLPNPPTAIFATNDLMALGAVKAIQDMDLDVPADVSVIGFDNIEFANLSTPSLTTIDQPKYKMGETSMQIMLNLLKAENAVADKGQVITLGTKIIYRNSVGMVRKNT